MIPPGMRAVAVRVNEVVGVAGFVVPGMRVDVLISRQTAERRCGHGHAHQDPAAESRSAFGGTGLQEGRRRQAAGAGHQSAGHAGTGRATEPGGAARRRFSSCCAIRWTTKSPKTPGTALAQLVHRRQVETRCRMRRRSRARRAAAVRPHWQRPAACGAAPPPKKEEPFVMEIISGTKKAEQKFDDKAGEGK